MIIVDLPPEHDEEVCLPAAKAGLNFIRLATPTTDDRRLPAVLKNTSGFIYYVSVLGITGTKVPDIAQVKGNVRRIKRHTDLPVAVGFGVKTAAQAKAIAESADAVVVGSALVNAVKTSLTRDGRATRKTPKAVLSLTARNRQGRAARPTRRTEGGIAMNWIKNFIRPKIRNFLGNKKEVPENMWVKCPETGQMVFYRDLEANQFVIPGSGYHMRMPPGERLNIDVRRRRVRAPGAPRGSRRSAELPRRAQIRRPPEGGAAEEQCRGCHPRRGGRARRPADRRHGTGLRLHGRFARHGGRRGDRRIHAARRREAVLLHPLRRVGRGTHAGGNSVADAAAAHDGRRAGPARGAAFPTSWFSPIRRRAASRLPMPCSATSTSPNPGRSSDLPARGSSSRRSARSCRKASSAPSICRSTA